MLSVCYSWIWSNIYVGVGRLLFAFDRHSLHVYVCIYMFVYFNDCFSFPMADYICFHQPIAEARQSTSVTAHLSP